MCENLRFCQNVFDDEISILFKNEHIGRAFEETKDSWVGMFFSQDFSFCAENIFELAELMTDFFRRKMNDSSFKRTEKTDS